MRVAVIGATGNFGRPVALHLLEQGYTVRALTRSAERARELFGNRVEITELDLTDLNEVIAALRACHFVHINMNLDRATSEEANAWSGYRNIADAARINDIQRITFIAGDPPLDPARGFFCDRELFGGAKVIEGSGIPYTLFNPCWFMEGIQWFIENGRAVVPGTQRQKYHWLAASNYAECVTMSLNMPECANKQLWIHGPEALTIPEAVALWCETLLPGVPVEEIAIDKLRAHSPNDVSWQRYLDLMAAMEHQPEIGDPTAANTLFGPPRTTLREFIRTHAR